MELRLLQSISIVSSGYVSIAGVLANLCRTEKSVRKLEGIVAKNKTAPCNGTSNLEYTDMHF